jgi:threonine synthase
MWRYRHALGLPENAPLVTLGEGNTPLVWSTVGERQVAFKLEFLNPTCSFKDRGTAVLVSFLRSRGVARAMDDSSGNAGASFAAYAASAGMVARVFVPAYASGPKRKQIETYGAEVVTVPGPRSQASLAVREAADSGEVYASHALLPHGLPGYATAAYELVEQLGQIPGTVILPVGQGNLLLAMGRAFMGMHSCGLIPGIPRFVGVQAKACAPLWVAFRHGDAGLEAIQEGETLAEGVRIQRPYRQADLLNTIEASGGAIVAVDEQSILPGQRQLARRGLYVEPTSAIVWDALDQILVNAQDPVVVVLTGSGLKAT